MQEHLIPARKGGWFFFLGLSFCFVLFVPVSALKLINVNGTTVAFENGNSISFCCKTKDYFLT